MTTAADMVTILRSYAQEHGCVFDQAADLLLSLINECDYLIAERDGLVECRKRETHAEREETCNDCNGTGECHWCDGSGDCYSCEGEELNDDQEEAD